MTAVEGAASPAEANEPAPGDGERGNTPAPGDSASGHETSLRDGERADTESPVAGRRPQARPLLRLPGAIIAALLAGGMMLGSFPNANLWYLAPVAVALFGLAVHRRRFRAGFGLGLLTGLVFFVPLLDWTTIVAGHLPWMLLSVAEACYFGLLGVACALASPLVDRARWLLPIITGAFWVGQEAFRDRAPFGGFPWGRLVFSQGDSPALRYAVAGGAPLVTFVVGASGGLLLWAMIRIGDARRARVAATEAILAGTASTGVVAPANRRWGSLARTAAFVAGAVAIIALGLAVPTSPPNGRTVQVAIVQGNVPRLGLDFNSQRRAVLDNHVKATMSLASQIASGQVARPDLVIWPENASDIDPLVTDDPGDADAASEITQAANAVGAPILVGAVLEGPGTDSRNAAIVWTPSTATQAGGPQSGPHGTYVKLHPVPFAEYVPLRNIARMVSKKVDLVRSDFVAGTTPGILYMPTSGGRVTLGDAICFEVAYDDIVRHTVTGGAQLLTVQTNNADFDTAEANQQLAMVRERAVEHGRDALMVSTVGISAFVDSSGGEHDATGFNVPAVEFRQMRLGTQRTLADDLGEIPEFVLSGIAVAALGVAFVLRRRDRIARRTASA